MICPPLSKLHWNMYEIIWLNWNSTVVFILFAVLCILVGFHTSCFSLEHFFSNSSHFVFSTWHVWHTLDAQILCLLKYCTDTLSAQILHKYSVCTNTAQMLSFHWTNFSPIYTWPTLLTLGSVSVNYFVNVYTSFFCTLGAGSIQCTVCTWLSGLQTPYPLHFALSCAVQFLSARSIVYILAVFALAAWWWCLSKRFLAREIKELPK